MKLISSVMLPAAKKFYNQAGMVVSQEDFSSFVETLFRKRKHFWGPYYALLMHSFNEAAKSQGYTTDDKWINIGLAQWEGPKNFDDIIILNDDELMVIYPCRKGVDKEAVVWWLQVLFGAYPFLQERIGASKRQIALFLRKRYFPQHISGYTYFDHVRISTFQERHYQILVALHELGHTLLAGRIGQIFIEKQWPEGKSLPGTICFFSGILEEGYLETEITSLFGMSAHLTFFQQFFNFLQRKGEVLSEVGLKDFLAMALIDFLDPEKERLIEFRGAPDLLGSFFQFIADITGEKTIDCLLNILRRILLEEKDARTIIEQTISLAWDDIPAQWANEIIKEVE